MAAWSCSQCSGDKEEYDSVSVFKELRSIRRGSYLKEQPQSNVMAAIREGVNPARGLGERIQETLKLKMEV